MSEEATARLRKMQERLAEDAARVTNREDLNRLRMYWGDIEAAIRIDNETNGA